MTDDGTAPTEQFHIQPRATDKAAVDRWPAIRSALLDLLAECSAIEEHGLTAFEAPRSLTYRAAEAVVIHFDDLLGRLPDDRVAMLPRELSLTAVRRTRNILSHDSRSARKSIVWDAVVQRIPTVIVGLVD